MAKDFRTVTAGLGELSEGNFAYAFPGGYLKRKDDFGILVSAASDMEQKVAVLNDQVHEKSAAIISLVDELSKNVAEMNEEVENISATTQQLAAGMEETFASSEQMASSAQSAEESAVTLSERAAQGDMQAGEMLKLANRAGEHAVLLKRQLDKFKTKRG